jgi:hypothetical protein
LKAKDVEEDEARKKVRDGVRQEASKAVNRKQKKWNKT